LLCAPLAACSSPPGVVFHRGLDGPKWPPPPDTPRIGYVGSLVSDRDLKPARSGGQGVADFLFGRKPVQGMVRPAAVCTEGPRVFVADPGIRGVHVFDLDTRRYELWRPPESAGDFTQPVGIARTPERCLLVADSVDGAILVFDDDGEYLGTLGDGLLQRPVGLAVDPRDGRIFVADPGAHLVFVLTPDGEEIARVGGRGVGPGEFNFPTHVALDGVGRLFVSDSLNFRVQVFDTDLKPLRTIGSKGDMPGYFAQPKGIAVDGVGRLFIADAHFEAIQIFDLDGTLLMSFGREGSGPGEFWLPLGMNIDQRGWIWIADSYNQRVQAFHYVGPADDAAADQVREAGDRTGAMP
jgi:DNA-binding beta-propeller fold protein YncE